MQTYETDSQVTIPHATRHDGVKTTIYALVGLGTAIALIAGTIWLFLAG